MDDLNAEVEAALDEVLAGGAADEDAELHARLRTLIGNCLSDNYNPTDVRAVIDLAVRPPGDE